MKAAQSAQPRMSKASKTAVVIGAGPTGSLMALYLAQMGWQVSVHERRQAEPEEVGHRRSYNIVLNDRGLKALEAANVVLTDQQRVLLQGNVRHTAKGASLSPGFANSISIDRSTLAQVLIQHGKNCFPEKIQYCFQQPLHHIDFKQNIACFQGEFGEEQLSFDLLIGADGVFSHVRQEMEQQLEGFHVQQNRDNMLFKICQLGVAQEFTDATEIWSKCFHTWPDSQPITLLAPPNTDGTLKGVLILPQTGDITYETLQTEESVKALFADKFPDIFPDLECKGLPAGFVDDLLAQKPSYGGISTICSRFNGNDNVVLLGDAAHSVWASLGQGCNVALESCRLFSETLAQFPDDLSEALSTYTTSRKPDTDAIARLSEIGFGGNKRAGNLFFFGKVLTLMILHKSFPKWFQKFALFQIGNAEVSYSEIVRQVQIQNRQLLICAGVLGLLIIIAIALMMGNVDYLVLLQKVDSRQIGKISHYFL